MNTLNLTITPGLASHLWTQTSPCFYNKFQERYLVIESRESMTEVELSEGTMFWSVLAADAILLSAYERSNGFKTYILRDNFKENLVVLSSRKWDSEASRVS